MPLLDWRFLHSDATCDGVHVWDGRFFRLDDHIARFQAGMQALHVSIPQDCHRITGLLNALVRRSGLQAAYEEMTWTRGLPAPGSRDPRNCASAARRAPSTRA